MANGSHRPAEHDEEAAKKILRGYLFYERTFTEQVYVPHRIPPKVAARLIQQEVKRDAEVELIHHACETARFYRLRDCLGHFAGFLSRDVREAADVYRSAESVDVLADLGDEDQQRVAYDHWRRLTTYRRLDRVGGRLTASFFHLGPQASPEPLEKELKRQHQEALKNDAHLRPGDPDPAILDDLVQRELSRTVAAKQQKDGIRADTNADRRTLGLARIYLGMVDYVSLGEDWAAYELIAEATERSDHPTVVKALRQALAEFERTDLGNDDPELVKTTKEDTTARAYDAIAFFGGELAEKEQQFLAGDVPPNPFTPT
jgi:hypothetical protein